MKQVLFIGAGHEFPKGPFAFLHAMLLQERLHAKALFFRPVDYATLAAASAITGIGPILDLDDHEKDVVEEHKTQFARQCEQHHLLYDIHENNRAWDKDLVIGESRFVDLILVSGEQFYAEADHHQPNSFLRETLHVAECPVIVVPEDFSKIQHLFMAYDGSKESMYAIKQFCYLFPHLTDLPTEIVYAKDETSNSIPDLDRLKQFTRSKLNCMSFSKLHFSASRYFATWINDKTNVMLISGSFGRSVFHYATRRSFAEEIIRSHKQPIFIAH